MRPTIVVETSGPLMRQAPPHRRFLPHRAPVLDAPPVPSTPPRTADPDPTIKPEPEPTPGTLYEGEPETCRRRLRDFLAIWLYFGLIVLLFKLYRIEGRALLILACTALGALPLHYALPFRWKKPFAAAISVGGLFAVFGVSIGLAVVAVGAALVTLARLPIAWTVRAGILAALTATLLLVRSGPYAGILPDAAWPLIGSVFMFRMILYMYELKHAREREPLIDAVGYFCLLPNVCFLHFPVVDYRTMQRGYFSEDIHEIMRRGLRMIFTGTVHLLLYRLIYHELLITPEEVSGPASLATYLACNYLLYLRVSGQFHLACGMLHLFGYKLPETHHFYLLATGFTDYWRRINIYWKDFMVRLVFNPVVFRLKRRPQSFALAAATLAVFVTTWFLHAYQSYWLRGTWGFSLPDALFWGILGALVLMNVRNDARTVRKRATRSEANRPGALALRAVKVAGTFTTIALLWSLWSSPSLGAWLALLGRGVGLDPGATPIP